MMAVKHGLLVSVVAATALILCRGVDTATTSAESPTTTEIPETTTGNLEETTSTTQRTTTTAEATTTGSTAYDSGSQSGYAKSSDPKASAYKGTVNSKKCSYKFVDNNKYDPRTERYDNVTEAMEKAFKNSPLAIRVFHKYLDPTGASPAEGESHTPTKPIEHPDLIGKAKEPTDHFKVDDPSPAHSHKPGRRIAKIDDPKRDFDVNRMFNQISSNANGFNHPISKFPVIQPNRRIGFDSTFVKDSGHDDFLNQFDTSFRRKKRMAVPPPPLDFNKKKPTSVCLPDRKPITAFVKGNDLCYVYKPDVQGIEMDRCKQQDCNVCSDTAPAQCVPQNLSAWIWAYCPHQGETINPEYIEYPAYCSCMVIKC